MERAQLLADLLAVFNESELVVLCTQLGIEFGELAGNSLWDKMRDLIILSQAKDLVPQLIDRVVAAKPELAGTYPREDVLSWIDRMVPEEAVAVEELPTLKWPGERQQLETSESPREVPSDGKAAGEVPTMSWPEPRDMSVIGARWKGDAGPEAALSGAASKWFKGRASEQNQLVQQLARLNSCSVVGAPKIGKSSLLYYLSEYLSLPPELKMLFAFLDLAEDHFQTVVGIHNGALAGWYARLLDAPPPVAPTLADFNRQVRNLHEAGFQPVLCLDSFEQLMTRPLLVDDHLLDSWQQLSESEQMSFVVASERPLPMLIKENGISSAFSESFHRLELGLLSVADSRSLLVDQVTSNHQNLPAAWIEPLLALCGRHPYYLGMAAAVASGELASGRSDFDAVSQKVRGEAARSWNLLWDKLPERQKSLLSSLIPEDPPLVLARQYQQLVKRGLLVVEDGRYQLFSQGFAEWLHDRR